MLADMTRSILKCKFEKMPEADLAPRSRSQNGLSCYNC